MIYLPQLKLKLKGRVKMISLPWLGGWHPLLSFIKSAPLAYVSPFLRHPLILHYLYLTIISKIPFLDNLGIP